MGLLTLEGYRDSGGVRGAIAKRADEIYKGLTADQQDVVRRVLIRLTEPGEGTEDTRRRATLREVAGRADEAKAVDEVVQVLAEARLVTTLSEPHDGRALGRDRPRGADPCLAAASTWLDEARAALRAHRKIRDDAVEWAGSAKRRAPCIAARRSRRQSSGG